MAPAYSIILRALFSKKCGRLDIWRKPGLTHDHILIHVSRDLKSMPWYNSSHTDRGEIVSINEAQAKLKRQFGFHANDVILRSDYDARVQ